MARKKKHGSKRSVIIWGVVVVAAIVIGVYYAMAKNSNDSATYKTIHWSLPTDISTLDLSKNTDAYSNTIIGNTNSNLLRVGNNAKVELDLAKKVTHSKDGLTYTATLRKGLKFSNGDPITAANFVYAWRRIVDPKTGSQYAYLASGVKNADKIMANKAKVSTLGVKAKGKYTIVFKLEKPMAQFKYYLAFSNFMPLEKSIVDKYGKKYGSSSSSLVYSGPYVATGWNGTSETITLKKNKYYWNAKNIKTDKIVFEVVKQPENAVQMFKQGQLDFAPISTSDLYAANKSNKASKYVPEARATYLEYNQTGTVKALSNKNIREALNLSINRKELASQVSGGVFKAGTGLAPTGLATLPNGTDLAKYAKQDYRYDPSKAKQLWKKGLKQLGTSKVTLSLLASATDDPITKSTGDYLIGAWEKALPGLTVKAKYVTFQQRLTDQENQKFDINIGSWAGDYPEGSTFYDMFTTGASYNDGKFSNKAYDKALKKASTVDALSDTKRNKDYKDAEAALYKESNFSPLYFRGGYDLINPAVKGVVYNATGLTTDLTHAYKK